MATDFTILSQAYSELGYITVALGKEGNDKVPFGMGWQKTRRSLDGSYSTKLDWQEPVIRLGMLAGEANGGLLVFDFDDLPTFDAVMQHPMLDGTELAEYIAKVPVARSVKGMHIVVRVAGPVSASKRLACRQHEGKLQILIETRGEGAQIALPNTAEVGEADAAGRGWEHLPRLVDIPIIDPELLDQFLALCREFDEVAEPEPEIANQATDTPDSLCDAFNRDMAQQKRAVDLLTESDFTVYRERDGAKYLTRSGRSGVVSASWGGKCRRKRDGVPMLRVFSSSSPWYSDKPLTPLDVVLRAEYGNNFKEMLPDLIRQYGNQEQAKPEASKSSTGSRGRRLVTHRLGSKPPKPVEWLVKGVLPIGRATQLFSAGGLGKSSFVRRIMADLVKGTGMFCWDAGSCEVLSLISEDDDEQQLLPCLYAEGCNRRQVERVHSADGVADNHGEPAPFSARPEDLLGLEEYLKANPAVKLIVVDPLAEFVTNANLKLDSGEDGRKSSGALQRIAKRHNVAVLIIAHEVKSTEAKGANKSAGSAQHIASCRHVWRAERLGPDRIAIRLVKTNLPVDREQGLVCKQVCLRESEIQQIAAANGLDFSQFSDAKSRRAFSRQIVEWRKLSSLSGDGSSAEDEELAIEARAEAREEARIEKQRERNKAMTQIIDSYALSRPERLDWPDVKALLHHRYPEYTELELETAFKALAAEGISIIADSPKTGLGRRFHHADHKAIILNAGNGADKDSSPTVLPSAGCCPPEGALEATERGVAAGAGKRRRRCK